MNEWQDECSIDTIEQWLTHTTVYIRIIPGQEWALWKVGEYYCLQQVLPKHGEKKMSPNLTELLLWFVLGNSQYKPLPEGNVISFSRMKG